MGNGFEHDIISIFLPIFCIKDSRNKLTTTCRKQPISGEPSSPRVSCIGQVKRSSSIPTTKKIFSDRRVDAVRRNYCNEFNGRDPKVKAAVVDIAAIDPPLPVVKRGGDGSEVNIWRRRFKGRAALEALEIQQLQNIQSHQC